MTKNLLLSAMMACAAMAWAQTSSTGGSGTATLPVNLVHACDVEIFYGSPYNCITNDITVGNHAVLKADDLVGDKLVFRRVYLNLDSVGNVEEWYDYEIAEVSFAKDEVEEGKINYNVTYDSQWSMQEKEYPASEGSFTADASGNVSLAGLQVRDCEDIYLGYYGGDYGFRYRVELVSGDSTVLSGVTSDAKTDYTSLVYATSGTTLSIEQMAADSVYSKRVERAEPKLVFVTDKDNHDIVSYEVRRYENYESGWQNFFSATRAPEGHFRVCQNNEDSVVAAGDTLAVDLVGDSYKTYYSNLPLVRVKRGDGTDAYNTYGCTVQDVTSSIGLMAEETGKEMSELSFVDGDGKVGRYYRTDMKITSLGFSPDYLGVMYRVWRKTEEGDAMEVADAYKARLQQDTHPVEMSIGYDESTESWGMMLSEDCKNEFASSNPNMASIAPKVDDDGVISFTDVIGARDLRDGDDKLKVTYTIRAYCWVSNGGTVDVNAPALAGAKQVPEVDIPDTPEPPTPPEEIPSYYVVAETVVEVTFDKDVTTAVKDVAVKTPASVRYANVVGMVSDKPFAGLNIVVTTYSDGTTSSEKKVF